MILLASRMGMRSGDIARLRIEDVQNRTDLDIIQEKTGNTLHLPLIREVKLAIDDYLSVKPSSQSDLVFINVYAPYNPVTTSTIRAALRKYIRVSGIDPRKRKSGPHALRASLASSMVNDDINYETVRKVLGHSSNNAIKHYARIDTERLRRYSLTMHLSVREAELSHEAYRHYRRTMVLFDNYLCRIHHTDKEIPESVIESWIKEVSVGISLNTSSQHVHYVRQLLLFLVNSGYKCFIPRTLITHDTYVPYLYSDEDIEKIFEVADSLVVTRATKNRYVEYALEKP